MVLSAAGVSFSSSWASKSAAIYVAALSFCWPRICAVISSSSLFGHGGLSHFYSLPSKVSARGGEEQVCQHLWASGLATLFPHWLGPALLPKAWGCLFSLQMFLRCSKMEAFVLVTITWFILASSRISGKVASTVLRPHLMALKGQSPARAGVINKSISVLLACSHEWNQGYKRTLPGCREKNRFQDSLPSVFLGIPKDVHMCPEISSGHLWIHCWPSQDHTVVLSWNFPFGGQSEVRLCLPLLVQLEGPLLMKTGSPAPKRRETGACPFAPTSATLGRWETSSGVWILGTEASQTFCVTTYLPTWCGWASAF